MNGDGLYSGSSSLTLADRDFAGLSSYQAGNIGSQSPSKYSGLGETGPGASATLSLSMLNTSNYDRYSSRSPFKGDEGVGCGRLMDPDIYTSPTRDTDIYSPIRDSPMRNSTARSSLRSSPSFRTSSSYHSHDLDSSYSSTYNSLRNKPSVGNYSSPKTSLTSDSHVNTSRTYDLTSPKTPISSSMIRSTTTLDGSLGYKSPARNGPGMSVLDLEKALEESEQRRLILTQKLKDAKETIEMQAKRINEVESVLKENGFEVDDLKHRTREYKKKINNLEKEKGDFQDLRLESLKAREQMQGRIDTLEFELRSLRSQHERLESEAKKKQEVINQLTALMGSLEADSVNFSESKENMEKEIAALKESLGISRSRADWLESHSHDNKTELDRLRQENQSLTAENKSMSSKVTSLKNSNQSLKEEAIGMVGSLQALREDKERLEKDVGRLHGTISDLKASLSGSTADKERFFEEKLELCQKIQSLTHDRERLTEIKANFEDQVSELNEEKDTLQSKLEKKEEEIRSLKVELSTTKKNSESLTGELSGYRNRLEKVEGQNSSLEQAKTLAFQQHDLYEQELRSLEGQIDTLKKSYATVKKDASKEKKCMEDSIFKVKEELRHVNEERNQMELQCHDLELKLRQAGLNLKDHTDEQNKEMDILKTKFEKLKAQNARKVSDLQSHQSKMQEMEKEMESLKVSKQSYQDQYEELVHSREELSRLQEDTRRLFQERAENQQVIQLLEMQKNILTKTSEESMSKANEADELHKRFQELEDQKSDIEEKLKTVENSRDGLLKEKEQKLANDQLFAAKYGTPEEIMKKMANLENKNKGLQDVNNDLTEQFAKLEKEHNAAKIRHGEWVPKTELRKVLAEKDTLNEDLQHMKAQLDQLEQRHHNMLTEKFSISSSNKIEGLDVAAMQKEKSSLETQISLLTSQLTLLETGKKRAEDRLYAIEKEYEELKKEHKLCRTSDAAAPDQLKSLQQQCSQLEKDLKASHAKNIQQEKLIASLKEDLEEEKTKRPSRIRQSLDDVGEELINMRTELHKLVEVIQVKDQAIEDLECRLRDQNHALLSREKMIEQLKCDTEGTPGLVNMMSENLKCVEAERNEIRTKVGELEKEKSELNHHVLQLTKELAKTQKNNHKGVDNLQHMHGEEGSKMLNKLQREIKAKDRMIESLEEQLRNATTSEILKLKRDAGRIDLLRAEDRVLQAKITNPPPLSKYMSSTEFSDPADNEYANNHSDDVIDIKSVDGSEVYSPAKFLPDSKEMARAKEGLLSRDFNDDDDEETKKNDAEVQRTLAKLNKSNDLGATLKFPVQNDAEEKGSAVPSVNQLQHRLKSLRHVEKKDDKSQKNPDEEVKEIQDSLDRFRIRRKSGLSSLSFGSKLCPQPTRSLASPDKSDNSFIRTMRVAECGYKADSHKTGHTLASSHSRLDSKKRVTFSDELVFMGN